jgi:two-component system response regulator FixJ
MTSEKGRVCVIDDDDALRESLSFLLRTAQIDVVSYPSATTFLDASPTCTRAA